MHASLPVARGTRPVTWNGSRCCVRVAAAGCAAREPAQPTGGGGAGGDWQASRPVHTLTPVRQAPHEARARPTRAAHAQQPCATCSMRLLFCLQQTRGGPACVRRWAARARVWAGWCGCQVARRATAPCMATPWQVGRGGWCSACVRALPWQPPDASPAFTIQRPRCAAHPLARARPQCGCCLSRRPLPSHCLELAQPRGKARSQWSRR